MKRYISIALAFTLVFILVACGTTTTNNEKTNSAVSDAKSDIDNTDKNSTVEDAENNVEWKQFLKEYEEWVDKYIEITKKYKTDSSDISILTDYSKLMSELGEWATKTENMQKELEDASPSEVAKYSAELARIAAKIAQAAS